MTLNREQINI